MNEITQQPDNITLATKYVEIKDKLTKLKAIELELRNRLLEGMQSTGITGFKTADFTVSRASRATISITDHALAGKALEEMGVPVAFETVLTKPTQEAVKTLLVKEKVDVEGAEATITEYVSIRMAKKEEK